MSETDWILDKASLVYGEVAKLKRLGVIRSFEIKDAIQDGWLAVMESLQYVDTKYSNAQVCSYIKTFIRNRLVNTWIRDRLAKKRLGTKATFEDSTMGLTASFENRVVEKITIERIVQQHPSLVGKTRQSRNQSLKRLLNRKIY